MQYVHHRKSCAVTADNLPIVHPDAYPYLMGIMMDVHGGIGVCFHETVWRVTRKGMIEHLLRPVRVKVRKGVAFFVGRRRFIMSRSLHKIFC